MTDPQSNSGQPSEPQANTPAGAQNTDGQQGQQQAPQGQQQAGQQQAGQSAPQADEKQFPTNWEEAFKHPRFKQITERAYAAEAKLAEIEAARVAAEEEDAKKRGEYESLLEREKAAHEATRTGLSAELRQMKVGTTLRDYLAGDDARRLYAGRAKYMMPFVQVPDDADDAAIAAAVKAAADVWIQDNPMAPPSPGGPATTPARGAGQALSDEQRRKASYQLRHL